MTYEITMTAHSVGACGLRVDNPIWPHVEQRLHEVYKSGGGVHLRLKKKIYRGVGSLEFRADPGQFVLMAIILDEFNDRVVCWQKSEKKIVHSDTGIYVGGNAWDARSVLSDLSIAIRIFKEVFESGDLSADSLQNMQ